MCVWEGGGGGRGDTVGIREGESVWVPVSMCTKLVGHCFCYYMRLYMYILLLFAYLSGVLMVEWDTSWSWSGEVHETVLVTSCLYTVR